MGTPQTHVGWRVTVMERDGQVVDRAEMRMAAQEEREKTPDGGRAAQAKDRATVDAEQDGADRVAATEAEADDRRQSAEWLMQRFADKTLEEAEKEIGRLRRLASQKPSDPRVMFETAEMNPTATTKNRLEYEERRATEVKAEWQKRRDEMSTVLLKAHDEGWKKSKQLAELEAQHAEIVKTYRMCESELSQIEKRWEQQRPSYEQRADEQRQRIEQAKKELPVVEKHEGRVA